KIFVAWEDCRFRTNCSQNDIVYTTSTNGSSWTAVQRVPIDSVTSGVDHLLPGLGVDKATSGASAHLGLLYYFFPAGTTNLSDGQRSGRLHREGPVRQVGLQRAPALADTSDHL